MNKYLKYFLYLVGLLFLIGGVAFFFSPKCKAWILEQVETIKAKINPIQNEGKPKQSEGRAIVNKSDMDDTNNLGN